MLAERIFFFSKLVETSASYLRKVYFIVCVFLQVRFLVKLNKCLGETTGFTLSWLRKVWENKVLDIKSEISVFSLQFFLMNNNSFQGLGKVDTLCKTFQHY